MRKALILAPGLLAHEDEDSILESDGFATWNHAEVTIVRQSASPTEWLTSALGLPPSDSRFAPGPLIVASMGAEPPRGSALFALNLLTCDEDGLVGRVDRVSEEERMALHQAFERLKTKSLTILGGTDVEHGLVWEGGSIEVGLASVVEVVGKDYRSQLPDGDGERILRMLIDDSRNLLAELEINRIRIEEGIPPLNLLWPWGVGYAPALPNLAFEYQGPILVQSVERQLLGLASYARLTTSREELWFSSDFEAARRRFDRQILHTTAFAAARKAHQLDSAAELFSRLNSQWLDQILPKSDEPKLTESVLIVSPSDAGKSLALQVRTNTVRESRVPFHERVISDSEVPGEPLWKIIEDFWRS